MEPLEKLIEGLNQVQQEDDVKRGYMLPSDKWHIGKIGKKFLHLNCGGSGAFLIEKATGELFNIKAAGVPDYNKKKKADIGNIATVDIKVLHIKRWNYLR